MTQPIKVSYQGIKGAYSYIASRSLFPEAEYLGKGSFEAVFESLTKDQADYLVLPIENTVVGSIFEVYDLLFQHDNVQIIGEVTVQVDHNLLGITQDIAQIKQVYSHPKALGQCQALFKQFPDMKPVVWEDTAAAAAYVSLKQDSSVAAIASLTAAQEYGLKVLKEKVQSNQENYTRFVVIKKNEVEPILEDEHIAIDRLPAQVDQDLLKTSLEFVAAHEPGSLLKCLQPIGHHQLNMSKVESRPLLGSPFQYLFYVDFEHTSELNGKLRQILKEIKPHTQILRHLGTYPRGQTIREVYSTDSVKIETVDEL